MNTAKSNQSSVSRKQSAPFGVVPVYYRTRKGSRFGDRARKSTNPNLRFIGTDRSAISMQRDAGNLFNPEPLVCCGEWRKSAGQFSRVCFYGDCSESWTERKGKTKSCTAKDSEGAK